MDGSFSFKTVSIHQPFVKLKKFQYALKKITPDDFLCEVGYRLYQGGIHFNIITRFKSTIIHVISFTIIRKIKAFPAHRL